MMIEALASGAKMIEDLEVLQAGAETIILAVVGIGLSLLSASKLKKKPTSTLRDEAPTSLATRGAPLPLLIGVDRVGPIFGWAGGRFTRTEELGGKKGKSGGGSTTIYYERGWHQLVMGPTTTLYEIRRNGELIFQGPIDRFNTPSGTLVQIEDEESYFRIYWGERFNPIPDDEDGTGVTISLANSLGVDSRWPYCCYIYWSPLRLGASPTWSRMDYVVGNRPFVNQSRFLLDSNAWIVGDPIYDPSTFFDLIRAVPGVPDPNNDNVCFFEFEGEVNDDRFFGDN